jgi:nucleoside-diphosphate-sugar epimerase
MRVLVTGVSGFSGSFVAQHLESAGFDVTGVYRRDTSFLAELAGKPNIALVRSDLAATIGQIGAFDAVVHAAATSPAPGVTAAAIIHDNIDATGTLIEAALNWKCRSFIYLSSLSIFGEVNTPVLDETTPIVNPDPYGACKFLCESMLAEQADRLPSLSLRLPGVLGPGAHRNWLSQVAAKMRAGERIKAFHLDAPFNNAAHISDIAQLVAIVLSRPFAGAGAVVLGAGSQQPVRRVLTTLAKGLGVEPRIDEAPAAKASFVISSRRAIDDWGYRPMEIGALVERYASEVLIGSDKKSVYAAGAPA